MQSKKVSSQFLTSSIKWCDFSNGTVCKIKNMLMQKELTNTG